MPEADAAGLTYRPYPDPMAVERTADLRVRGQRTIR